MSIIDSSTIARHILNVVIPYTLISVSVTLIIYLLNLNFEYSKVVDVFKYGVQEGKFLKPLRFLMDHFNATIFKYVVIILLFCFFYIGINITLVMLSTFSIVILLFILTYSLYSITVIIFIKYVIKGTKIEKDKLELQKIYDKRITYKNILINNLGIIIVLFSFIIGLARATHVSQTTYVKVNDSNQSYILYMTTISGIGLYNKELKQASFKSWDSINNLSFSSYTKRSIGTFFDMLNELSNKKTY